MELHEMKKQLSNYLCKAFSCPPQEVEKLVNYFKVLNLEEDEYFLKQGEVCNQVAFVVSGAVRAFDHAESKKDKIHNFYAENKLVTSYTSYFLREASAIGIQAMMPTTLLTISREDLEKAHTCINCQCLITLFLHQEQVHHEKLKQNSASYTVLYNYDLFVKENPTVAGCAIKSEIASYLDVNKATLSRRKKK